jgi:hypothetical protein
VPKALPETPGSLAKTGKLINRIVVSHRPVAFGTNRSKVVDIERSTLALRDVVTDLERERGHHILTPGHETLVFKEPFAAPQKPYLLA